MTGTKTISKVAILLLLFGVTLAVGAQRSIFLGQTIVNGTNDHDTITVGRADGKFHAVQIQVQRAPIEFQRVLVHYGNGTEQALEFRDRIDAGGSTRWIDLDGGERTIKSVEFWYSKGDWASRKPTLRLYGR